MKKLLWLPAFALVFWMDYLMWRAGMKAISYDWIGTTSRVSTIFLCAWITLCTVALAITVLWETCRAQREGTK